MLTYGLVPPPSPGVPRVCRESGDRCGGGSGQRDVSAARRIETLGDSAILPTGTPYIILVF
jgi:hypothetical protein